MIQPKATQVVTLSDAIPFDLLSNMLDEKYVKRQMHPTLPYAIYNYTAAAAYDRVWNPATLNCRGLVTRFANGSDSVNSDEPIVARPWAKFFNHSEHAEDTLPSSEEVVVTNKMDGSLGILVPTLENGLIVSTRGSFASEQSQHATRVLREQYSSFKPNPGWTYLWEIVYPQNRIVVNYGNMDDLVLLGAVDIASGESVPLAAAAERWDGPVVSIEPHETFSDALSAPPRENAEGIVVHFTQSDLRVKIKQSDYVALHKIVTNLSERAVWEVLAQEGNVTNLISVVPDEYYSWVHEVSDRLLAAHASIVADVENAVSIVVSQLSDLGIDRTHSEFRKRFAQLAQSYANPGWLFSSLDNRSFDDKIWVAIKPDAVRPIGLVSISEDSN